MTHFTVLVVGDNVEEQLLPYHEFECTGLDNQYVQDIDVTDDFTAQFKRDKEDGYATPSEYLTEYHGINIINDISELDLNDEHKYGYAIVDGDKIIKVVRRTNPNKKSKRATNPTHQDSSEMDRHSIKGRRSTTGNIGLAIWRLKCFYETFVQGSTAVILLNFCAKNPPHRQAENR